MNSIDLNGNIIKWKHKGKVNSTNINKSQLHLKARNILHRLFPTLCILEEVEIEVLPQKKLYLDFYIPILKIAIEVQGQQHYIHNTLYHKTRLDFYTQIKNDLNKKRWCEINNIDYVELPYHEKETEWITRLKPSKTS